jgi:hypothetical protein
MAQGVGPKFKPQSGERERDKERDRERERERERRRRRRKEGREGGRKKGRKEGSPVFQSINYILTILTQIYKWTFIQPLINLMPRDLL